MPCCVRRSFSHSEAGEAGWRRAAGQAVVVVAYWRGRMFPASAGATLLQYTSTDDAELEKLPVVNGDGSVGIMVANHAVDASGDHNGPGSGAERAGGCFRVGTCC